MRGLRWGGLALLVLGVALIAASVATGEGQLYLILFIPVFTSSGLFGLLGVVAVFAGLFVAMASAVLSPIGVRTEPESREPDRPTNPPAAAEASTRRKFGGVVMIGPIPVVFGSDRGITQWMIVLGFVLLILTIVAWLVLSLRLP